MTNAWESAPVVGDVAPPTSASWERAPVVSSVKEKPLETPIITNKRQEKAPSMLGKYLNLPLAGIGEAALNMGSGITASAVGGLQGLSTLAQGQGVNAAVNAIQGTQQAGTYQPRTNTGKSLVYIAGIPLEVAGQVLGKGGGAVGEALGGQQGRLVGESVGEALAPTLATLMAGKGALNQAQGKTLGSYLPSSDVVKGVRDVLRTRTPEGKQLLAEEYLKGLTTPTEAPQIVSALERRAAPVVPGSPVTSADAIARANRELSLKGTPERFGGQYVALQDGLSFVPETSAPLATIKLAQEKARADVLNSGAGTDAQYAAVDAIRKGAADATYTPYGKTLIGGNATLSALLDTPAMKTAVVEAAKIAANKQQLFQIGKDVPEKTIFSVSGAPATVIPAEFAQYPLSNLQLVKMALDNMIKKPEDFGIAATARGEIANVRAKLIDWIENKSPAYEAANKQYAIDSIPLNQMDLWKLLRDKFIAPTGKETPGTYLRTLRDETKAIKQSTRLTGKTSFDEVFNTQQSALAARLAAEMEMELVKKRMAGEVQLPGIGRAAEGLEPKIPNILWRPSMVANFLLRHLAKRANTEVNITAAKILADPQMLANVLKQVKVEHRPSILKAIKDAAINKNTAALGAVAAQQEQK